MVMVIGVLGVPTGAAAADTSTKPVAVLDGKTIPTADVGRYHCHDLDYPIIRCYRTETEVINSASAASPMTVAATDYVIVYDGASFSGPSMLISENYDALAVIGWNDRISSFKSRNSGAGRFNTDWFAGGTSYAFCCNQQVSTLGSWSDTFSSVYRG